MTQIEKAWQMIEKLHSVSEKGLLEWEPSVRRGAFQVSFPDNTVVLSSRPSELDQSSAPDIIYELKDVDGEVLQAFSDVDFASGIPDISGAYVTMSNLYSMARSKALGTD